MKETALLVLDMLNDFVLEGAPLEVPSAREVVPNINREIAEARKAGVSVIYICDSHDKEDQEFERMGWPAHAVEGSGGAKVCDELAPLPEDTVVSMNFWGFTPSFFGYLWEGFGKFILNNAGNLKAEYYIPSAVNRLIKDRIATVRVLSCVEQWYGMTYREDREMVVNGIRRLVEKGEYPVKLWR